MSTERVGTTGTIVVTLQEHQTCPATRLLRRIGDKWSPVIIRLLAVRSHGFNELDRSIEGLSRRMLTRTLRALEDDGFISRTVRAEAPTRVEYALTELGHSLREQLLAFGRWAVAHDGLGATASGSANRMTDQTSHPELDTLLDEAFRGHDRLSRDEIYRRAVAADLPAESLTRIDALPEGEYAQDEAAEVLRQNQVPGEEAPDFEDEPDFADEHDNTTADSRVTAHEDLPDLEPESPRGLGGMDIPPSILRDL